MSALNLAIAIRRAQARDLPAMLEIYNDVILTTTAIYAEEPLALDAYGRRFEAREALGHPTFVAVEAREIIGFASYGEFRAWPCYRRTAEHSLHVAASQRGRGVGRSLLTTVCEAATAAGKHVLLGGIDADNGASLHLHRTLGFEEVARLKEVGLKFDRWLDLVFMQKILIEPASTPRFESL